MRFLFLAAVATLGVACGPGTNGDDAGTDMGVAPGEAGMDGSVDLGGREAGPPPSCATLAPIDMGATFDGEDGGLPTMLTFVVTMGDEDTATYQTVGREWHDGDTVRLLHGLQGGWMVMPAFDVDTTAAVPTTMDGYACFDVYITNDAPDAGAAFVRAYSAGVLAVQVPGRPHVWHLSGQQDLLAFDPTQVEDMPLTLSVHLVGPTGEARLIRTVTPSMTAP